MTTTDAATIEQTARELLVEAMTGDKPTHVVGIAKYVERDHAIAAISTAIRSRSDLREQGQVEGFAAAISQLRDLSAQKPTHLLAEVGQRLADHLEQSRQACSATPITTAGDMG